MKRISLSLVVMIAGGTALGHLDPRGVQPRAVTGVVLVTLDTTRADRLSPYGFMGVRMPHLERLSREGVLFQQALSVAPLTLPAHASILTGLLPPSHGVRDNADHPLAGTHTTLAETLQGHGFRTGAFVGSVVLQSDRGLAQGFEAYGDVQSPSTAVSPARQRPGNEVVDEAIGWLDGVAGSPFFLWAHLYDAHAPYTPPEGYRSTDPYIGELMFMDAQLGRLLDALDRLGLAGSTIVVVAGDHGEGLGDHGEATHGLTVYDSVLRVPLIVRAPSIRSRSVTDTVRLVDIAPTVLDLLGVASPASDGVSLVGALRGGRVYVEAYAESMYPTRMGLPPVRSLRDERFKLIDGPSSELYDLTHDPFEERNAIGGRQRVADAMRARLHAIGGQGRGGPGGDLSMDVPRDVRDRLAALGYVTAGPPPAAGR